MSRYIRFVVAQTVGDESRQVGLFTAAYHLRREGELYLWDRERLDELLGWFEEELPTPPRGTIPHEAIFWFIDAGPFYERMRDLTQFVAEYGFTVEFLTLEFAGRVVYQDQYQLAALPRSDRFRSRRN